MISYIKMYGFGGTDQYISFPVCEEPAVNEALRTQIQFRDFQVSCSPKLISLGRGNVKGFWKES
jgi:hypothetical protein